MMLGASIIIPNLHSPVLGNVLAALRRQTVPPLEVLVIGQDRYGVAAAAPDIRFIETPHPTPPALARNIGVVYARGVVCCFLDADCVPAATWLERLLAQQQQGRPVVSGSIAIGVPGESFWQRCDNIASLGWFLATAPAGERHFLSTANLALRRDVLHHVGLFNEQYRFPASEDTDLSLRLRSHGYPLYFAADATVYHRTQRTTPARIWRHIWLHGHQWIPLREQHGHMFGVPYWQRLARRVPLLARLLIPLVALRDMYDLYSPQPTLLRRFSRTMPVVYWARWAGYVGQLDY
ncbi:MAG: glycosyltransferase [Chloroflexaceae bacterium]|nr:glycosyltransferase [Chloroflexaceae bacterium]